MTTQIRLHWDSNSRLCVSLPECRKCFAVCERWRESKKPQKRSRVEKLFKPPKSLIERESIHWVKKNLVMGSPLTDSSTKVPFSSGRGGASGRGVVSCPNGPSFNQLVLGFFSSYPDSSASFNRPLQDVQHYHWCLSELTTGLSRPL